MKKILIALVALLGISGVVSAKTYDFKTLGKVDTSGYAEVVVNSKEEFPTSTVYVTANYLAPFSYRKISFHLDNALSFNNKFELAVLSDLYGDYQYKNFDFKFGVDAFNFSDPTFYLKVKAILF